MKKIRRVWLVLALLICTCFAATAAIPQTLAYMQQESNTVRNKINVVYTPPEDISVPVRVHKTVRSLGEETVAPEGFAFALCNTDTGEVITLFTDEYGYAAASLPFTAADVGMTYHYELTEIPGTDERITYSDAVYTIRIVLTVDMYNCINADVSVNGVHVSGVMAEFENVFEPIVLPDTGDDCMLALHGALLLASAAGLLLLRKFRAQK